MITLAAILAVTFGYGALVFAALAAGSLAWPGDRA